MVALDEWLEKQPAERFPRSGGNTYPTRFKAVAEYLNRDIHPHVESGAVLRDNGYLTDHGPEHIQKVIHHMSELIGDPEQLHPYETYLLLMASHFHDVGNIFGRAEHEKRAADVMAHIGPLGGDTVEHKAILQIAGAHGGASDGDKDTISRLPPSDHLFGVPVRFRALAAILRFADELSDDTARAARFPMKLGVIPKSSEIFHVYAERLNSVSFSRDTRAIELRFHADVADVTRKFGKGTTQVYLFDEILSRTTKMHTERIYCSRFMRNIVEVDEINVRLSIYKSPRHPTPAHKIEYSLRDRGYPATPSRFKDLCPELDHTGASLKRLVTKA
jgi:hypothetical protein